MMHNILTPIFMVKLNISLLKDEHLTAIFQPSPINFDPYPPLQSFVFFSWTTTNTKLSSADSLLTLINLQTSSAGLTQHHQYVRTITLPYHNYLLEEYSMLGALRKKCLFSVYFEL